MLSVIGLSLVLVAGVSALGQTTSLFSQAASSRQCQFRQAVDLTKNQYGPRNTLVIPSSQTLALGGAFTIELAYKDTATPPNNSGYLIHAENISLYFVTNDRGANLITVSALSDQDGNFFVGPEVAKNTWHHVAVMGAPPTKNQPDQRQMWLLVDGKIYPMGMMPFSGKLGTVELGTSNFNGQLDELRITARRRYSFSRDTYRVPAKPYAWGVKTLLVAHFDGDLKDATRNHHDIQANNQVSFVTSDRNCPQVKVGPVVSPSPSVRPPSTPSSSSSPNPSGTPMPSASPQAKLVFITSQRYTGNLGGHEGADQKCQSSAQAANLPGIWRAWLSTYTSLADSRLAHSNVPYKLLNGVTVAANWNDLVDQTLSSPINLTETGQMIELENNNWNVWTNTWTSGSIYDTQSHLTCNNFTSNDSSLTGRGGVSTSTDYTWTASERAGRPCNATAHLYCFQQ